MTTTQEIRARRKAVVNAIKAATPNRPPGFIARRLKGKRLSNTQHYQLNGSPRDPNHYCTP